jgi:fibrillarin-like rRNA methylase
MMTTNKDKEKQEYIRKKLRIAFLGESSLMTQNRVSELCKKFFEYGIEYAKNNS